MRVSLSALLSLTVAGSLAACETVGALTGEEAARTAALSPPSRETLRQWVEPQFQTVMSDCAKIPIDSKKLRFRSNAPDPTYIPSQITRDQYLGGELDLPYEDLSGQTLQRIFGAVISGEDLELLRPAINDQIGVDYARTDELVVAPGYSTWRYTTSCAAAASVALNARFQANWGLADVNTALAADMNQSGSLRQEFLYGIFESPVAAAIRGGPNTDAAAIVHYNLMLWEWQAQQAQDAPTRYVVSQFAGVASYFSSASRSRAITSASVQMGAGTLAGARVSGSLDAEDSLTLQSFKFAAINDPRVDFEEIPTPAKIAERASVQSVFFAVQRNQAGLIVPYPNPTYVMIEGNPQISLLQFSRAIPKRFCERPWESSPAPAGSNLTLRSVSWIEQDGAIPMTGCLIEAFTSAPSAAERNEQLLNANVRLVSDVRGSHFALPLQTVTLGSTRRPIVSEDRAYIVANPRADVDQTNSGWSYRTSTWKFRFVLDPGPTSSEAITGALVEPGAISIEPTSCSVPQTSFDAATVGLDGDGRGAVLTLTKIHGPNPAGAVTYTEASCTLKGSLTLELGPNRTPVTRSIAGVRLEVPIARPVAPPPPPP